MHLVIGNASADSSVNHAIQHHTEWVDFEWRIAEMLLYQRLDLLVRLTHRLDRHL